MSVSNYILARNWYKFSWCAVPTLFRCCAKLIPVPLDRFYTDITTAIFLS